MKNNVLKNQTKNGFYNFSGRNEISSRISVKTVLNVTVAAGALLAFFMGWELISAAYTMGFLALFTAAFFIEWRGLPHPPRLVIDLAALTFFGLIFTRMRLNYAVEALMEALLLMTAVKMLEDKRPRDYTQIVLLNLAMVIAYAMLSVEKAFIVYCFGMGLVSTLILFLATWMEKDKDAFLSGMELRQICVRMGSLFCVMLPLCLTLFFGLPRAAMPIFAMRGQYGTSVTGFSDQVRLGDAASLQTNRKLAFRAEMEPLESGVPYWRGMVLEYFEGNVWIASRQVSGRGSFIPESAAPRVKQSIFLEAGNRGYLFALDQPISVTGIDVLSNGDGIFRYDSRNVGRRLQYEAVSVLSQRMRPLDPNSDKRRYLTLPFNFIPRLRALVEDRTREMSDREKIEEILRFLSPPDFSYSLEGLPATRDALEQFLFVTKRGNCEYFASAMGVMLRMAGVPSRLVAGYRDGVYNSAGGYYMVQEQNAHVWVEAWDKESGAWTRYDPTPMGDGGGNGISASDTFALYMDLLDYQWSKMVVNYSWEMQADLIQTLREVIRNPRASLTPTRDGLRRFGGALFAPAIILGGSTAFAAVFYFLRGLWGRRPEIALLNSFLRAMRRRGYVRHESEGLSEFLSRVDDTALRILALPFVQAFQEFYYRDRDPDAMTLRFLRERVKKISRPRKLA
jgi:hypothetical protein